MKLINAEGHVNHRFSSGDPSTGARPTRLDADWCNIIQEEIANVITKNGVSLDDNLSNNHQLHDVIMKLISQGITLGECNVTVDPNATVDIPILKLDSTKEKFVKFTVFMQETIDGLSLRGAANLTAIYTFLPSITGPSSGNTWMQQIDSPIGSISVPSLVSIPIIDPSSAKSHQDLPVTNKKSGLSLRNDGQLQFSNNESTKREIFFSISHFCRIT